MGKVYQPYWKFNNNWLEGYQVGGSIDGYKEDSQDRFKPYNIIPSGNITMQNVKNKVIGIDNTGNKQTMYPGSNYQFPGNFVVEFPIRESRQYGGPTPDKAREMLHDKTANGKPLTDKQRRYFGYIVSQKMQTGGSTKQNPPIYGTREQVQNYQDSLRLYNLGNQHFDEEEKSARWTYDPNTSFTKDFSGNFKGAEKAFMSWENGEKELLPSSKLLYNAIKNKHVEDVPIGEGVNKGFRYFSGSPLYKKPIQPIIEQIDRLPVYSKQINTTPQQYTPEQLQVPEYRATGHNYSNDYLGNYYVDGKLDIPRQQEGGQLQNSNMDWLSQDIQQPSLQQKQRAYHGRKQSKVDRSTYLPHPSVNHFQEGGYKPFQDWRKDLSPINPVIYNQANTPETYINDRNIVDQNASARQVVRNLIRKGEDLIPGAPARDIVSMIDQPLKSAVNLTDPASYYRNTDILNGSLNMALDALPLVGIGKGIRGQNLASQVAKNAEFEDLFSQAVKKSQDLPKKEIYSLQPPKVEPDFQYRPIPKTDAELEYLKKQNSDLLEKHFDLYDKVFTDDPKAIKGTGELVMDPEAFKKIDQPYLLRNSIKNSYNTDSKSPINLLKESGVSNPDIMAFYNRNYGNLKSNKESITASPSEVPQYLSSKSAQQKYGGKVRDSKNWLENF